MAASLLFLKLLGNGTWSKSFARALTWRRIILFRQVRSLRSEFIRNPAGTCRDPYGLALPFLSLSLRPPHCYGSELTEDDHHPDPAT